MAKQKNYIKNIDYIRFILIFNEKWIKDVTSTFTATEDTFILLLSGCSAVLEGRSKINTFDVIRANRTYLKLINNDISKLM